MNAVGRTVYMGKTTPLLEAAKGYNASAVRVLLDVGANPNHRDVMEKNPLDYAKENDQPEV